MKYVSSALVLTLLYLSQPATAKDKGDFAGFEGFVDGCSELVQIYEKREQRRFFAGQTTSLSEALRAGYCRGIIEQYKRQNDHYRRGCHTDWYEIAEFVARQDGAEYKFGGMESLLETACRGH